MEMVVSEGIGVFSMHRLAKAVEFTPGALYRYFDSKDALLATLTRQVINELQGALEHGVTAMQAEGHLAQICVQTRTYRVFARVRPQHFGLLAMMAAEPRVLIADDSEAGEVMTAMVSALQPLSKALEEAAQAECLSAGRPWRRALALFGSLQGVVQLRKQARLIPEIIDVDGASDELVRALLIGWGASEVALQAAQEVVERHEEAIVEWLHRGESS